MSDSGTGGCIGTTVTVPHPAAMNAVVPASPRRSRAAATRGPRNGKEVRGLQRADVLIARGQIDKAITHLRKLITDLPDSTRGHLRIASLLHEKRQSSEAIEILRGVVSRAPDAALAREVLAEMCLDVGRPQEAIDHCRALLKISARSLFARDILSAAYLQCGKLDESLRVIQEMIYLDPLDASHHFKKGVLLQQKGYLRSATESFLRVLNMEPDSEAAEESRAALEMLDSCQIRQIITLAVEDIPFRLRLQRHPETAVTDKGFLLSGGGMAALSQMRFDEMPSAPPGWQQYYYN